MEPIRFNFHLTYFFTSLQFFTQTWCETWVHVFKKSTSGGELRLMQQLCRSEMDGLTNGWMHEYTQLRSDSFPGSDHRERIGALCADDAADR